MTNLKRIVGLMSVLFVLSLAAVVHGAEGDAPKRMGSRFDPDAIEKALTGDQALTPEQKTKLTESYNTTVKSAREKLTAAKDADAKKALYPEMKAAVDSFKASVKTILKEEQYKKIEDMMAPKKKPA